MKALLMMTAMILSTSFAMACGEMWGGGLQGSTAAVSKAPTSTAKSLPSPAATGTRNGQM